MMNDIVLFDRVNNHDQNNHCLLQLKINTKFVYCFHINGTNHTYFHFNHSSAINIVQLTFGALTIKISVIVEFIGKRKCIWE